MFRKFMFVLLVCFLTTTLLLESGHTIEPTVAEFYSIPSGFEFIFPTEDRTFKLSFDFRVSLAYTCGSRKDAVPNIKIKATQYFKQSDDTFAVYHPFSTRTGEYLKPKHEVTHETNLEEIKFDIESIKNFLSKLELLSIDSMPTKYSERIICVGVTNGFALRSTLNSKGQTYAISLKVLENGSGYWGFSKEEFIELCNKLSESLTVLHTQVKEIIALPEHVTTTE